MDSKNFQLLQMIENIDVVTESAEFDVINAMYNEYEKFGYFLENAEDISDDSNLTLIMEGSFEKSVKKGLKTVAKALKKLWGMIVSFFKSCKKALSKVFKKLKKETHGAKKTVNQILRDMKKAGKVGKKKVKKLFEAADVSNVKVINIPASDLSDDEYKNQRAVYPASAFMEGGTRFETIIKDDGTQAIYITNIESELAGNVQESTQPSSDLHDYRNKSNEKLTADSFREFYSFIKGEQKVMEFNKLLKGFLQKTFEMVKAENVNEQQVDEFIDEMDDRFDWYAGAMRQIRHADPNSYREVLISMDDFSKVQTITDTCMESMGTVPDICNLLETVPDNPAKEKLCNWVIDNLNKYLQGVFHMQMIMNKIGAQYITDDMQLPDPEFFGAFDSFELLDDLMNSLIESHIPQKFVMYSAWLLSAENIRGNGTEYAPIWGQSRGCLFPPNEKFIYKIALSGRSVVDNKTEAQITEYLKPKNLAEIVAEVYESSPSFCVLKMQKLYGIGEIPQDTSDYIKYFTDKCRSQDLPFNFTDLHRKNIGFPVQKNGRYTIKDHPAIIDYAMIRTHNLEET